MNTGAPWPDLDEAEPRVRVMQTKLHQWAKADPGRRFDDLFNLVYDPAFLAVAWRRVRGNKGARTAGVDGVAPRSVVVGARGTADRAARRSQGSPVRSSAGAGEDDPEGDGKVRRLGIPTDRRPGRAGLVEAGARADLRGGLQAMFAMASVRSAEPRTRSPRSTTSHHPLGTTSGCSRRTSRRASTRSTTRPSWAGCDDRIGDKRVLGLVKAFLRAGVLTEDGVRRETITGTPQGGILSPLLANIALSVLDEHFTAKWEALGPAWTRAKRRRAGEPVMRLVRYADDFVVMVHGTRDDAEALWDEVSSVLAPMGLRLSEEKTRVCHIDEGFDFLGWRIQRRAWRGRTGKTRVYTYPSKKSLASIMDKVRTAHPPSKTSNARRPAAPVEPGAAGLVQLLPARRVISGPSATSTTSPSGGSSAG